MDPKARLGRSLLELLQESPHGLTPPTLLELLQERGIVATSSGRGPYQRILRILAQFEAKGLVRKVGRRYVLDHGALEQAAEAEVAENLHQALERAELPTQANTWFDKLRQLLVSKKGTDE